MDREFFLCLGITFLINTVLFLYFRNRFKVMEHKVNTIFQLVQSHAAPPPLSFQERKVAAPEPPTLIKPSLIEVSDDEFSDSDEDSSDGESDHPSPNLILGNDMKQISVMLETELNKVPTEINLAEKTNDLDGIASLSDNDNNEADDNNSKNESDDESEDESEDEDENTPLLPTLPNYNKLTVVRLKQLAGEKGLSNFSKMRKPQLVELLSN